MNNQYFKRYEQIKDNLRVEVVLQQMLLEHMGVKLYISPEYILTTKKPNKINIGICIPSVFGFEVLGITLLKMRNKYKNINIYFFLPFKDNIIINEADGIIYLKKGCVIKDEKKILPIMSNKPLLLDKVFFPAYKKLKEAFNLSEVYEKTLNKRKTYLFLKAYGIPTTDWQIYIQNRNEIRKKINALCNKKNGQIVVKIISGSSGSGIRMFTFKEKGGIINFCLKTFNNDYGLIIEKRIISYPIFINQIRIDWNVRVIVVFDLNNNPMIDLTTTCVRYKPFDDMPVSSHSGNLIILNDCIDRISISQNRKELLKEQLKSIAKNLSKSFVLNNTIKGIHSYPSIFGIDIILDENLEWRVIEINSGNEGYIQWNLYINNYNPSILKKYLVGLAYENTSKRSDKNKTVDIKLGNLRSYYWGDLGYFVEKINLGIAEKIYYLFYNIEKSNSIKKET